MKLFKNIKKSLGLMQAFLLLLSSLVIGLFLSVVQIYSAFQQQEYEFKEKSHNIINLSLSGAASAAWTLDEKLATEVLQGIVSQTGVQLAEIRTRLRSNDEQVLARLSRSSAPSYGPLSLWIGNSYYIKKSTLERVLIIDTQPEPEQVGSLLIEFDSNYEAQKFLVNAMTIFAVGLVEALLIGLVLFIIARRLITKPISRAANVISQIDPDLTRTEYERIAVPSIHEQDELGQLLNHTNQLLDRLKSSQSRLMHLATKDALTGLVNRNLIKDYLAKMLAGAKRSSTMVAVAFIDLDRFKSINDTLGHEIGDQLLQYVAKSLLQQVREEDVVGRLGGDEFLLLSPNHSRTDVVSMAERILKTLSSKVNIGGYEIKLQASIGISLYPNDGDDVDTLLRCADLAMYEAKGHKTTNWYLFSEEMKLKVEEGLALEAALERAIEKGELEVFLQPQYGAKGLQLHSCEALLRWERNHEYIDTQKFIEVAELTGLIGDIGQWVLAEVCKIINGWGDKAIPIALNVSVEQLSSESFVDDVIATVENAGVDPAMIELEITETALMKNLQWSFKHLTQLRKHGFRISIDDFGTGYSSLSYLVQLPIDALKIDRSFISGRSQSMIVLDAIIALAKALDIRVVAEGIETSEQKQAVIESGCDYLQGYFLGEPLPVSDFKTILEK